MKYLCLLMLLFFAGCSPHKNLYKIYSNCTTDQNVLEVSKRYLTIFKGKDEDEINKMKVQIKNYDDIYYLQYFSVYPDTKEGYSYSIRGETLCYSIIIRKRDCEVLHFERNIF